jgi:hypothetical protein
VENRDAPVVSAGCCWAGEATATRPMRRKIKEVIWAKKMVLGQNQQKHRMAAEMLFELIQVFDFKIKGLKYFLTEFELNSN